MNNLCLINHNDSHGLDPKSDIIVYILIIICMIPQNILNINIHKRSRLFDTGVYKIRLDWENDVKEKQGILMHAKLGIFLP